jgi:hypothetical protein
MKTKLGQQRCKGLTRLDVIILIGVAVVLVILSFSGPTRKYELAARVSCLNNLKQIGNALRIWAGDHNNRYPMHVPVLDGGTLEFADGPETFRHFQVLSNELWQAPKVVICPADTERNPAQSFSNNFNNSTLSYLLGIDAANTNATMLAAGDRNLSDSDTIKHGPMEWSTNRSVKWTKDMHNKEGSRGGNILLQDGSVHMVTSRDLQSFWQNTGVPTNRLALP